MVIYIIVVTYNGINWIDKCFGSLRGSVIPVHTIAIDNASNDGTIEKIKSDYPEVELIISDTNIGFGQANNIGIKKALENDAEYIVLMNQDAQIKPNTINGLVNLQLKNPEFDVLSPVHLSGEMEVDKNFIVSLNREIISDLIIGNIKKPIYEIEAVHAAFWLMTRKCIEIVGGFDPLFFYRGEDEDYIKRCKLNNIKFGISLNHFAHHQGEIVRSEEFSIKEIVYRRYVEYLVVLKTRYERKLWKVFRRVSVQLFGEAVKALLNLNMKLLYINTAVQFKLLLSLKEVSGSRKISLKQKKAFL